MPTEAPQVLSIAALTHTGQLRKHNEDYVGYHLPPEPDILSRFGALMVVCDGVGGSAAGEVASEHAVHSILNSYYRASGSADVVDRLVAAIEVANEQIYTHNARDRSAREMSTTVVAAAWLHDRLIVAHAGDSRAYLVRNGQIAQLTEDHSVVAEMVQSGDLTVEEAEHHPWRNRITRGLGMAGELRVEVNDFSTAPGDILVLCSDGLTRHVPDGEIAQIVLQYPGSRAVRRLVDFANLRGGKDNVSVIVAEWLPEAVARERGQRDGIDDAETDIPGLVRRSRREFKTLVWYVVGGILAGLVMLLLVMVASLDVDSPNTSGGAVNDATEPSSVASPPPLPTPVVGDVNAAIVNLRNDPSTRLDPAGNLNMGERVTIESYYDVDSDNDCIPKLWLSVVTDPPNESKRWVCAKYVNIDGNEVDVQTLQKLGVPRATATPTAAPITAPPSTSTAAPITTTPSTSAAAPTLTATPIITHRP